jgi:DNA-binding MarR family transcriptional regulator
MKSKLLHEVIDLVDRFQSETHHYSPDIHGFKLWVADGLEEREPMDDVAWEGKDKGRSPESVINTLLVHLNRYAKTYSKSAIYDSDFSTQEEFIYLINLKAFGAMSKMELIKKNVQDKPTGMQIINRLIAHGWIGQSDSDTDGRSKIIKITKKGKTALEQQMKKIRQATKIVAGDLTQHEKIKLIQLLQKLDHFHNPIFLKNYDSAELLDKVKSEFLPVNN